MVSIVVVWFQCFILMNAIAESQKEALDYQVDIKAITGIHEDQETRNLNRRG